MRFPLLAAVLMAGPMAGCQSAQTAVPPLQSGMVELARPQLDAVMRSVTPTLKNPTTAQFGNIRAARLSLGQGAEQRQGYAVCGEVRSQATFGSEAMVPFVGGFKTDLREFRLLGLGGPSNKTAAVLQACQQAGIAL